MGYLPAVAYHVTVLFRKVLAWGFKCFGFYLFGNQCFATVTKEFDSWMTTYYPDKKDTWVTLWYVEKWTDKKGKKDSLYYVDDVLLKNGKILVYNEKIRHFPALAAK